MLGVVVAFVLGLFVGLLVAWYPTRQQIRECEAQNRRLQATINEKEQSLQEQQVKVEEMQGQMQLAETPSRAAEAQVPVTKPDDLKRIEGIGPKISQILQNAGIMTFAQLAGTPVSRLQQILSDAELTLADPTTWPDQAKLAAEGNWAALAKLQDDLKGGRRVEAG